MGCAKIDTEIPAGNIHLLKQDGNIFTLTPDLRDTEGFWFYWKFRHPRRAGGPLLLLLP